ncbi:MAG: cell division protein FtsQ/DivIB [Betaproteobacteria bacterium]|nr:cell division protein FtsQ/DivIB [Betaproteobacteria bacterium]
MNARTRTTQSSAPPAPLTRRRGVVIAAGALAFVLSLAAVWAAMALLSKERSKWLPVREVAFSGEFKRVDPDALKRIGAAMQSMGGSLLTVDLAQVRAAVKEVPWVREATVSRRFPGTIVVGVEEHEPFARWEPAESPEEDALVSVAGEVFRAESADALPLLGGPRDSAREVLAAFRAFHAEAERAGVRLAAARLSARRAWLLTLDNGTTLALGRSDAQPRLDRYLRVQAAMASLRQAGLAIDLRYANGIAVSPSANAQSSNKGKS